MVVGGVAAGGGAGARFRVVVGGGGGCGAASLPRGAHHPPPDPLPHAKPLPVAVVGPHHPHLQHHHHHSGKTIILTRTSLDHLHNFYFARQKDNHVFLVSGAASRITSVPSISPQGQMALVSVFSCHKKN